MDTVAKLFFALYPLAGIAFIIGYIPQILTLMRAKSPPENISITSWVIWLVGSVLSLGYVHFHLSDFMMVATTLLTLSLSLTVLGLTIYNKSYRFRHQELTLDRAQDGINDLLSVAFFHDKPTH